MDLKTKYNINCSKLVCSLESLHKIDNNMEYDIVVLDECESIFIQFSSSTIKNKTETFLTFKNVLLTAQKTVFADAFITNRTLDFIRSVLKDKTKCILTNVVHNEKRNAIQIDNKTFNNETVTKIYAGLPYAPPVHISLYSHEKKKDEEKFSASIASLYKHLFLTFYG